MFRDNHKNQVFDLTSFFFLTFSWARRLSSRSENWSNSISSTSVLVLEVSASGSLLDFWTRPDPEAGMVMLDEEEESMISVNAAMESNFAAFFKELDFLWLEFVLLVLLQQIWLVAIFIWFGLVVLKLEDCCDAEGEIVVVLFWADLVVLLSGVASDSWTSSKISCNSSTHRVINIYHKL